MFRQRAAKRLVLPARGIFLDQYNIPCFRFFNDVLQKPLDSAVAEDLQHNISILHSVAEGVAGLLQGTPPQAIAPAAKEWMGDYCYGLAE